MLSQSFISDCPDGQMDKEKMKEVFSTITGNQVAKSVFVFVCLNW